MWRIIWCSVERLTHLEVVGYNSTVTVFTIFALIPQAIRAINKQICNNGMSVNMHAIPHAPVPNRMKTKPMKPKFDYL